VAVAVSGEEALGVKLVRFGADLPYTKAPYSKRSWGHPLHSLCSYQGKLKPALAHTLLRLISPDARILDPLGGVGTISFEAACAGRAAWSNDLSPLAFVVSRGKLAPPTLDEAEAEITRLSNRLAEIKLDATDYKAAQFGLNARVVDYFHSDTLDQVLKARKLLLAEGQPSTEAAFVWGCLLHVLHGNRPYALSRTSHPITPFSPRGPFVAKSLVGSLRDKARRALAEPLPPGFRPGVSLFGDFRTLPDRLPEEVDAVVTSPPFLGMRFDRPNWLRLWFCGWLAQDFHGSLAAGFLERQQVVDRACYADLFRVCSEVLSSSGILLMHVGSGAQGDLAAELPRIAADTFRLEADVVDDVAHLEQHGLSDKRLTTRHHLLAFARK
jgi:hypothetical protein